VGSKACIVGYSAVVWAYYRHKLIYEEWGERGKEGGGEGGKRQEEKRGGERKCKEAKVK